MANASYNAVMDRYKTGPRGPKIVTKETLSRLSDPAKGKFVSPSREAKNDEIFKQKIMRSRQDDSDGTSIFLTEYQEGKSTPASKPPIKSLFRSRLDDAARAAESIAEDGSLSPSKYSTRQTERKGGTRNGIPNITSKNNSQTRQAAARLDRVKAATRLNRGKKAADTPSMSKAKVTPRSTPRTTPRGNQMSRNRQAKVDSQASIMRGRDQTRATYDSRTGRVHQNRSTSRVRKSSTSREPSVDRRKVGTQPNKPMNTRRKDTSVDRNRSTSRTRGQSVDKPEWVDNTSKAAQREKERKEKLNKMRESRLNALAEKKAMNSKNTSHNSSIRSNGSTDSAMRKVPTGIISGSRSAAAIKRKPVNSNNLSSNNSSVNIHQERRARTEQRSSKRTGPTVSRKELTKSVSKNQGLKPSEADDNGSLQYSASTVSSPLSNNFTTKPKSKSRKPSPENDAAVRQRLFERKGLPKTSTPKTSNVATPMQSSAEKKENPFPERYRRSDIDKLLCQSDSPVPSSDKGTDSSPMSNVEVALKKAEEISKSLRQSNENTDGKNTTTLDNDTASFANLLATHAKRISGKLESAQSLEENYKKLTGAC